MKCLRYILVVLSVLLWISGCEKPPVPVSGLKIKIGVIAPVTGVSSGIGKQGVSGISIARHLYPYLDNGDEIELIIEDDQSEPVKTIAALDSLVNEHKVSAILLLSGSDSAVAVAKVADKYKTPILATIATNPEILQYGKFVSQLAFNDKTQAMVAALFVRDELFIKRVAIFNNPRSVYSSYLAREFATQFKAVGGQVTDFINLTDKDSINYTDIVTQVNNHAPALLYLPVDTKAVLAVAGATRAIKWAPIMLATDGMLSTVIEDYQDDLNLVDDMLETDLYSDNMDLSAYGEELFNYVKKSDVNITTHVLTAMDGYGFLLNVLNQCDAPISKKCINNTIHKGSHYTGITGKITIDENGRADRTLFISTIKNGELEIVVRVR